MPTNALIELILNSNLTWVTGLTIMTVVLRPVLTTLTTGLIENQRARVKAEEDRNDAEREQSRALEGVKKVVADSTAIQQSILALLQPFAQIPHLIEASAERMTKRADARDAVLNLHSQRLDDLAQVASALPDAVLQHSQRHFDPQLEAIRSAVDRLSQRLETRAEPITAQDVAEIRAALVRLERSISRAQNNLPDTGPLKDKKEN